MCSQHIYYGDTIKFFEKYENEVIQYISDALEPETLGVFYIDSNFDQRTFKNNLVWTFIELVAMEVVDTKEEQERRDDLIIEGYNPSRSMTESRYAQVWSSTPALTRVGLGTHIPYVHPVSQSWQQQSYNLNPFAR